MTGWIILFLVLAAIAGWFWLQRGKSSATPPQLPYGPTGPAALGFDELERRFPLGEAQLRKLTPQNIEALDQDQLDQVYARLQAGPIPDGPMHGSFFFAEGGNFRSLADVLGGVRGGLMDLKMDLATRVGELLWQGKVFYRDAGLLRNIIDREEVVGTLFGVRQDELRIEEVFGEKVALLFPARLYVGDSQLDPRRPSVIIDYAETAQIDGYVEKIDRFAGRQGLMIRDEIRMVRPGFYLGRAYFGTLFGLNFTLCDEAVYRGG